MCETMEGCVVFNCFLRLYSVDYLAHANILGLLYELFSKAKQ